MKDRDLVDCVGKPEKNYVYAVNTPEGLPALAHRHLLEFDVSQFTALEAALKIFKHVQGFQSTEKDNDKSTNE